MSLRTFTVIFIGVSIMLSVISCEKEDKKPEMPDINIIDVSEDSEWDYFVLGKEDYFFIKADEYRPNSVVFHCGEDDKDYPIIFGENGLPYIVTIGEYIFILSNYEGNVVDLGVIYPNGNIEIIRDIETDYNWGNLSLSLGKVASWSDLLNWTGRVVGAVPCIYNTAITISTSGLTWPLMAISCGNYLLGLAADIMEDEFDIHNSFTEFVSDYSTVNLAFSCQTGNWMSCLSSAGSRAYDELANSYSEIEDRSEDYQTTIGALEAGYGDIQITLSWDTTDDIDLWVTDPSGEKIYWNNKYSQSGGYLDYDDRNGFGPENVYWPEGQAPSGKYLVQVDHYDGYYSTHFTVLIQAFGYTKKYSGTVSPDETVTVAEFSSNSPLPKLISRKSEYKLSKPLK